MKLIKLFGKIKILVALLCIINFSGGVLSAQDDFGITNRPRITNTPKGATKKSAKGQGETTRVIYKAVYKTKETRPTGLALTTLPNADISLESIGLKVGTKENSKANDQGILTFEKLKPGRYKLSTSLKGYQPEESEISIVSEKILTIPIILKQLTYDFSIQTNVEKGEVKFAPVQIIGQNLDGTLKVQTKGEYCIVPIINRTATINGLPEGSYNIDVRSAEPEYQPALAVIEIPEDIPEEKPDDPNKSKFFSVKLENNLSILTFKQILTQDAWMLPENWKIDEKGLKAVGIGIALPINKLYRYYKDFEMRSTGRLLDNSSIGFVVRAVDGENYYLIQLTGSAAAEKYRMTGFIVKNGKPERIVENPIPFLADIIGDQKYFSVIIKGQGNTFEVIVEDSKTANNYPVGKITDQNNNFQIGAVGIGVMEKSSFEVGDFTVCNQICK